MAPLSPHTLIISGPDKLYLSRGTLGRGRINRIFARWRDSYEEPTE